MQYDEFIDQVQQGLDVENRQDVETIVAITLATLAEPLSREATNLLSSQLPGPLKELLNKHRAEPLEGMQSYTLEEFYNRVKSRLSINYQQAIGVVQAVTLVLPEAVTHSVITRIKQDLPGEYGQLFTDGQ